MCTHTEHKCPLYLSSLFNLHIITLKSCSLPHQIDFDSSSSQSCKSEILPRTIVYVLENSLWKKFGSVCVMSWRTSLAKRWPNQPHRQHRNMCGLHQNTNMEMLLTVTKTLNPLEEYLAVYQHFFAHVLHLQAHWTLLCPMVALCGEVRLYGHAFFFNSTFWSTTD